jgi:cytochrome c553
VDGNKALTSSFSLMVANTESQWTLAAASNHITASHILASRHMTQNNQQQVGAFQGCSQCHSQNQKEGQENYGHNPA